MVNPMHLAVVVLAAGKGTRMRSDLPKVLHPLGGRPLVFYSVDLARQLSPEPPVLVVGHGAEIVQEVLGERCRFVEQSEQLGTAHAVAQAERALDEAADTVLVYAADMPLLTVESMRRLITAHGEHDGPVTLLTVVAADPRGFGRVVRDPAGDVLAIVEEAEATPEQRALRELNAGVYCFDATWLWQALKRIQPSAAKGEYYLTDTVGLAVADGYRVVAVPTEDEEEVMGINTRVHLAEAETILRRRINHHLMHEGVTMVDPEHTYVHPGVVVGRDSLLWPGVCLLGETAIGEMCEIGPHVVLSNVRLGAGSRIGAGVVLADQVIAAGVVVPPE